MSIDFANETSIRNQVLKNVSLSIAVFVLFVSATNLFITHDYWLGVMELIIAFSFVSTYIATKKERALTWQPYSIAFFVTGGLLYGFYNAKPDSAIVMWVFALPPLYLLLFNRGVGSTLTFMMLFATSVIYFPNLFNAEVYPFALINFILPYCIVWLIAFNHESVRLEVNKRLEKLAKTDTLTGAFNLLALREDADTKLHCCQVSHILHFDLDYFKRINDSYGHSAGDEFLKAVVHIAKNVDRAKVYRLGGEEFCIVFCAKSLNEAIITAEEFRSQIEHLSIQYGEHSISGTISAGLLALPSNCSRNELDNALKKTDKALYRAKDNGRNQIVLA
ncbi:GGDEF domain-containing protein [Vibrio sp. TBV020]|uniref:GGDEF domain-containing protein n=1 Tax=Vibrio sp. TBV020 TaxID=3137398 RepID=UPI0038CD3F52